MNEQKKYDVNNIFLGDVSIVTKAIRSNMYYDWINLKTKIHKKELLYKDGSKFIDFRTGDVYNSITCKEDLRGFTPGKMFVSLNQEFYPIKYILLGMGIKLKSEYEFEEIMSLYDMVMSKLTSDVTLAIIKPDGMKNIEKILEMIYNADLKVERFEVRLLDESIVDEHYSHLLNKPFYPEIKSYMTSGEVAIMILTGENAVEKLRNLMGPTDSTKASSDTIRGKFGTDITRNAIHGSDSKENAEIEINRFFNQKQKRISH